MMVRAMRRRPIHSSHALVEPELARQLDEPVSHRRPKVHLEVEASSAESHLRAVSVWDVLERVLASLGPSAAGLGIQVALLLPAAPGVPEVTADPTRFAQILMRLGSNAIKYNRAGGSITFAVRRLDGDLVRVSVTDTGMGMARGLREALPPGESLSPREPPVRREGARLQRPGMDLAISRRLAKLTNGSLGFRSLRPKGSELWLDLPVYPHP
jgi:signal transduction histidine kinase